MEERQLIEGCIRGESWAQKTLYELYAPAMMGVCQRYVCNRETARDLLHDGFVKLFTKIHTYSGAGSFSGWTRRVFVTTALEYIRHKDVLNNSADIEMFDFQDTESDVSVFEHLSANELIACIAKLPGGLRAVFNLHAIEGYSHDEIAKELKIKENTSRSKYNAAKKMLREMMEELAD